MRGILCVLLLSPAVVVAGPYKCMAGGQVTYSQFPCGTDAQSVPNSLSGIADAPGTASTGAAMPPSQTKADTGDAPAQPERPASGQPGVEERKADCRARYQQYRDSVACFAPYWRGTHLDSEAYNHCTEVKQPTDCSIDEMQ